MGLWDMSSGVWYSQHKTPVTTGACGKDGGTATSRGAVRTLLPDPEEEGLVRGSSSREAALT